MYEYIKHKIAVRHYRCGKCQKQIRVGEKITIVYNKNGSVFDVLCFNCGEV